MSTTTDTVTNVPTSEEVLASTDGPINEPGGTKTTESFAPDPIASRRAYEDESRRQAMKRRNYKYWSETEVRKILEWMTSEENSGKFAKNKAQACREVAKELFNGDEYMAISIRSKLMSLEKSFFAAERLRTSLNESHMDEAHIAAKIKDFNRFQEESRPLFVHESSTPFISLLRTTTAATAIATTATAPTTATFPVVIPATATPLQNSNTLQPSMGRPILPRMPEVLPSAEPVVSLESPTTAAATPAPVLGDREQRVSTIYPYEIPTQPTSRPLFETRKRKADDDPREYEYIKEKKIAIRQARYAARQAEFEALKAKHEEHKMEFAVRLAEVEKERDLLGLRKLELELEIVKLREKL